MHFILPLLSAYVIVLSRFRKEIRKEGSLGQVNEPTLPLKLYYRLNNLVIDKL